MIKNLLLVCKIFFIGLVLQFFLHTFVTFQLGLDGSVRSVLRMWKEFIVLGLLIFTIIFLIKNKKFQSFWQSIPIKKFFRILLITLVVVAAVTLLITKSDLITFILSIKYTFSGFVIFFVFFVVAWVFFDKKEWWLTDWYVKMMKLLLFFWLCWWWIIWLLPKMTTFVGYNEFSYEWAVGEAPPVAYYTVQDHKEGFTRNQFLFERPISRGFFLIALWPFFFLLALKNKDPKTMLFRWGMYGLNIVSTFSRAAWIAWIVITIFLLMYQFKKQFWKLALYVFVPLLVVFVGVTYMGKDQILNRAASNKGHIEHLVTALKKIKDKPLWGQGAGTAGPVTHHRDDIVNYNPENQYLQIWLEYGLLGFTGWMVLYIFLHLIGYKAYLYMKKKKLTKIQKHNTRIVFAFSLGILWLSIEGLVLHSFVDRMIVYPVMALFGIVYALYLKGLHRES